MKVLLVGALGDLGVEVADRLEARGHEVWGLTRSPARVVELEARGVRGVVGDLMEVDRIGSAVTRVRPDAIVSVPIALPERGPIHPRDLAATNRLRVAGTRNLLSAAISSGVRRLVVESIVAVYGYGDGPDEVLDESSQTAHRAPFRALAPALDALHQQEEMVLDAERAGRIQAVVARLGFYYGATVGSTRFIARLLRLGVMPVTRRRGALPWIEIGDAAAGIVAALERGRSGEIYNIVDDGSVSLTELAHEMARELGTRPPRELPAWMIRLGGRYAALMGETRLHVSNEKAKRELAWYPRFPTISEGVKHAAARL